MRIHEVSANHFKGLEDVTLPWSSAVVLFGPNDSGKTRLLEALISELAPARSGALSREGSRGYEWPYAAVSVSSSQ